MMPCIKIFLVKVLLKLRMWLDMAGSDFSRVKRIILILRDFNDIKTEISLKTGKPILQRLTLTYTVGICLRKGLQGKK